MTRINAGIIGDGDAAFRHAHAININPAFSLMSIAPKDKQNGEELRRRHAIASLESDSQYLLEKDEIDAIVIVLPVEERYKETLFALSYSKIVIVESPLSLSSEEIETLMDEVENGAFIFNCNPYLYLPLDVEKGPHRYSISFSSLIFKKEEMAQRALELAVSLFSAPLSVTLEGDRIILRHEDAEGEIELLRETDDNGLTLMVDSRTLLDKTPYYYGLGPFYSYLYKTVERGGDVEKMISVSLISSRIKEKLFS